MINKPSVEAMTNDNLNRYELVIATAKCARIVTDEYVKQRENAEKSITGNKEADKPLVTMIDKELKDEKAVKIAINRIHTGEYYIIEDDTVLAASEETEEEVGIESTEDDPTVAETTDQE